MGSVEESAFRKLRHLQVLDIEANFEPGASKEEGRQEEEAEEEDKDEDEEDEDEEVR